MAGALACLASRSSCGPGKKIPDTHDYVLTKFSELKKNLQAPYGTALVLRGRRSCKSEIYIDLLSSVII